MKLKKLIESDPRVGGAPSGEEMFDAFMNQVQNMDHRALVALISNLTNELKGDSLLDFLEIANQVLRTDEVLPPG